MEYKINNPLLHIKRHFRFILFGLGIATAAGGPVLAQDAAPPRERLRYEVSINGGPADLRDKLRSVSRLVAMRERAPYSDVALERRAEADIERLEKLLESEGYYAGSVDYSFERREGVLAIIITVSEGPRYSFGEINVQWGAAESVPQNLLAQIELWFNAIANQPARAETALAVEARVISLLQRSGFPQTTRSTRNVRPNAQKQTIDVDVTFSPGRFARFGRVVYEGLEQVEADYLDTIRPWQPGAPSDKFLIDDFGTRLRETALFSSVTITEPEVINADGTYDIVADLREAPPRSVSTGASFSRDKGIGGNAAWTHRNFSGRGEKLAASIDANELEQSAALQLTKPAFWRSDQTLDTKLELRHTNFDAYDEDSVSIDAAIKRNLENRWIASIGAGVEIARLSDLTNRETSYLVSLPLGLSQTTIEDILDPYQGHHIAVELTSYVGTFSGATRFLRTEVRGSFHHALNAQKTWIASARARIGSIVGEKLINIPQNQRLYAGGGGSVRGYEFQFVGPVFVDPVTGTARPAGGRSLAEASFEVRAKLTSTVGVVPFLDLGAVSRSSLPLDSVKVQAAAGLGFRYYTDVGPFRLDFAVPLNRRRNIDSSFQFYIAFGQAF